jgi:hypothetical protein
MMTSNTTTITLSAVFPQITPQGRSAIWWCTHGPCADVSLTPLLRVDPAVRYIQAAAAAGAIEDVFALIRQGVSADEARLTGN